MEHSNTSCRSQVIYSFKWYFNFMKLLSDLFLWVKQLFPSNSMLSLACEVIQILLAGVSSDGIANIALLTPIMQGKHLSIVQADSNRTQNFPAGIDRALTTKACESLCSDP